MLPVGGLLPELIELLQKIFLNSIASAVKITAIDKVQTFDRLMEHRKKNNVPSHTAEYDRLTLQSKINFTNSD